MPVKTEPASSVINSHHKGSASESAVNVPFHSTLPTSTLSRSKTSSSFASTSTPSPDSASAYVWPVIAVSTFAVIVTAVLIVTIVVFALLCKKKRQRGYHTLLVCSKMCTATYLFHQLSHLVLLTLTCVH